MPQLAAEIVFKACFGFHACDLLPREVIFAASVKIDTNHPS